MGQYPIVLGRYFWKKPKRGDTIFGIITIREQNVWH